MKKLLVVVDMQNDFVDGALGTPEAQNIVPNVVNLINDWEGDIIRTMDTHYSDYLQTQEGKNLPVEHCIFGTEGWSLNKDVGAAIAEHNESTPYSHWMIDKYTFGSIALPDIIRFKNYDQIKLVGLCTDICVVSNALLLKANFPETEIVVDASCCAGVTPETHKAAIDTMRMCQINVIGD